MEVLWNNEIARGGMLSNVVQTALPGKVGGARNLYTILWFRCVGSPRTGYGKIRAIFASRVAYV